MSAVSQTSGDCGNLESAGLITQHAQLVLSSNHLLPCSSSGLCYPSLRFFPREARNLGVKCPNLKTQLEPTKICW